MVNKIEVDKWLSCGRQIAESAKYYNCLSDMNGDNQPDFDNVYYFADEKKPNCIFLKTAITRLKRRASSGNFDRALKGLLMEFIATSELLFASSQSTVETQNYLLEKGLSPNYNKTYKIRQGKLININNIITRPSRLKQFNNWVAEIGEFFDSLRQSDLEDVAYMIAFLVIPIFVVAIIAALITDGFGAAIGTFVFSLIVLGIIISDISKVWLVKLLRPIIFVLRWLFYDARTLFGFMVVYSFLLYLIR